MATASSVCVEASEKECSVCNEPFTEPKLLPCGHLLCQHCVLSWLHKQKDASCPLCRCPIVDTEKWGEAHRVAVSISVSVSVLLFEHRVVVSISISVSVLSFEHSVIISISISVSVSVLLLSV